MLILTRHILLLYIEHGEHISGNKFNRVNIYSADGRSVLRTSVKNSSRIELDVELLENGLYFIELSSEFESFTTKFVKN
ncbi:MAG: T9SS type A sorting domain-containing protein [Bacteroidetes bacterium]|nr:T9SS type A sorting domain-containing protein [Bacteroidota bacterium]